LELLGRFEMDPMGSDVDGGVIYPECVAPFYEAAQADPYGFVAQLHEVVAADLGGFATYGASRLVFELLGLDFRSDESLALLDRAIAFKRERGLPSARLTGYEWQRWLDVHGPGSW
jgi:hypothetical protein